MTTGDRIRELRISKGLSQEELGAIVGVKKAAINKYELNTVVNLKRGMIAKLAEALDTSPTYLMGWEEKPDTKKAPSSDEAASDEQIQFALFGGKVDDESYEEVKKFAAYVKARKAEKEKKEE